MCKKNKKKTKQKKNIMQTDTLQTNYVALCADLLYQFKHTHTAYAPKSGSSHP